MKEIPLLKYYRSSIPSAQVGEFVGWKTIIAYTTVKEEHKAVREDAGIFDISHMTRIKISGEEATSFLQKIFTADVEKLKPGRMKYGLLLNEQAGILDDITVYKISEDSYIMVSNAVTREKVIRWLHENAPENLYIEDFTDSSAFFAVQGPRASTYVSNLFKEDLSDLKWFSGKLITFKGCNTLVTRSGYTGGDGYEVILPCGGTALYIELWEGFVGQGVKPCGLACRDICRLEAGYPLYGQDLDESMTPLEAGLMWAVKMEKPYFIGKAALELKAQRKPQTMIALLEMVEPGVPRPGYPVIDVAGKQIGAVTSGGIIPSTGKGVALAKITTDFSKGEMEVSIVIRDKPRKARIRAEPFVRLSKG